MRRRFASFFRSSARRRSLRLGVVASLATLAASCAGSSSSNEALVDSDLGGGDAGSDSRTFPLDTGPGTDGADTTSPGICQYSIEPINAVVKIDTASAPPKAGSQPFTVKKDCGGTVTDVTAAEAFSVDDATLGGFAGNVFTSATSLPSGVLGKTTLVHAQPGNPAANVTVIALRTTGDQRDFFFVEAYKKPPEPDKDVLKFSTNLKQVDVAFLEDTTASMGGEIANLKASISDTTSGLIAQLKKAIPSVGIAIAHHEDFPVAPFGYTGTSGAAANIPFELYTSVTTSAAKAQSAVNLLAVYFGGDNPEAQYEAQYQLLTGEGFIWTAGAGGSIAAHPPSAGTTGGAGFRAGSLPIVVEITDASWHTQASYDGPTAGKLKPHSRDDVVAAYAATKAKFVGIQAVIEKTVGAGYDTPCTDGSTASCDSAQGFVEAKDMAEATGSVVDPAAIDPACAAGKCCTGIAGAAVAADTAGKCPLVFNAKTDGTGVSDGIVKAIQAISVGAAFDVTAVPRNDPTNGPGPDGAAVDAPKSFIKSIRAMDEGDAGSGCPKHDAKDTNGDGIKDTFVSVTVGTPVCFEVDAKQNDTVPPTLAPQFFNAFIDVIGVPGSIKLDTRSVLFLVPPKEPGGPI